MEEYMLGPRINWVPTEKRELKLGLWMVLIGLFLGNCVVYGGWNLGYALGQVLVTVLGWRYLRSLGHKGDRYTNTLLGLCVVIAAGFGWSADILVKAMMIPFLAVGINMAFCQMTGKNRHAAGSARSLLDAARACNGFGFGKIGQSLRGVGVYLRSQNSWAQNGGAILVGIGIAVPLLLVVIPLLMSADAAFEGLMDLIPALDAQILTSLILGASTALFLYSRAVGLGRGEDAEQMPRAVSSIHVWTVNTVLGAICAVYLAYLFSQLAYFVGGFAGILPKGYTAAEYARRGFFEMTCLSAINLGLMAFGAGKVSQGDRIPGSTRGLCLFLALVSEFLVAASAAKMMLYISSFGLTRLRVLTMVVMGFLGITTALIAAWLFVPKLQYMKIVMLLGLSIGAGLLWVDVDTQIANYNVNAYLSGRLDHVDLGYLVDALGPGSIDALIRLDEADDPNYEEDVLWELKYLFPWTPDEDFRSINGITWWSDRKWLNCYPKQVVYRELRESREKLEALAQQIAARGAVTEQDTWPGYTITLHTRDGKTAVDFRKNEAASNGARYGFCFFPEKEPFNIFSDSPLVPQGDDYICTAGSQSIRLESFLLGICLYEIQ